MALTDVRIRNAKAKTKAYKLADPNGLFLQVTTKGSKLWRMKFRHLGKEGLPQLRPVSRRQPGRSPQQTRQRAASDVGGVKPFTRKATGGDRCQGCVGNTLVVVAEEVVAKRERED